MKNAKLFIWTGYNPDYYSGLAFAIAKNEAQVNYKRKWM